MTNAELAVLSLIAEKPRYGLEIENLIKERGIREWTEIGFSSIYYLLKKLEKAGLIESHMTQEGRGPARKVYHLTPAGVERFRTAVIEALSTPTPHYPQLQLGLANLPAIGNEAARAALAGYRAALGEHEEHVRARWQSQRPLPYFVDAMFEYSLAMIQAEQTWIEKFIAQLENG